MNISGYKATLPNGKQVLIIDGPRRVTAFQRWQSEDWEPVDLKIFDHVKLPPETIIRRIPG